MRLWSSESSKDAWTWLDFEVVKTPWNSVILRRQDLDLFLMLPLQKAIHLSHCSRKFKKGKPTKFRTGNLLQDHWVLGMLHLLVQRVASSGAVNLRPFPSFWIRAVNLAAPWFFSRRNAFPWTKTMESNGANHNGAGHGMGYSQAWW